MLPAAKSFQKARIGHYNQCTGHNRILLTPNRMDTKKPETPAHLYAFWKKT